MRLFPRRSIKGLIFFIFAVFLTANLLFLFRVSDSTNGSTIKEVIDYHNPTIVATASSPTSRSKDASQQVTQPVSHEKTSSSNTKSIVTDNIFFNLSESSDVLLLRKAFEKSNQKEYVKNLHKFDLKSGEDTVVIIVQVHNRPDYLKYLIESLKEADGISQSLLVFSHDYHSKEIHDTVALVDFCPLLQIYYPFAMQLYPKEFPGEHPRDCPRNINKVEAVKSNCNNAQFPDHYGHYREAKYAQIKHHWFWKASYIFDQLTITKHHRGPILFLEEDHYVAKDFLHTLLKMYRFRLSSCRDCQIFTLGNYDKKPSFEHSSQEESKIGKIISNVIKHIRFEGSEREQMVDLTNWVSSKHNMGMAFNRDVWNAVKKCAKIFCEYDDYNWDWSLQNIGMNCMGGKLKTMILKGPRVFHIGECGQHHKGRNCNPQSRVASIKQLLSVNDKNMFPNTLSVFSYPKSPSRMPKPNGGWGDKRDQNLCLSFVEGRAMDVIKNGGF